MIKSNRGSALAIGLIFVAVVGGGVTYVMKQTQKSEDSSNKQLKFLKGRVETKKLFSVAGFLISNNLILCRKSSWHDGQGENQCRWSGKRKEGNYNPEEFGLANLHYKKIKNNEVLTFDFKESIISRYDGVVSFELVDVNDDESLKEVIGDIPDDIKNLDKDHHLVKVSVELQVPTGGKGVERVNSASLFKRPIAVPKVSFSDSSCLSQCDSSKGEHSSPSCRGPFTIDGDATTDIVAVAENEGPGVIYDLKYERKIVYDAKAEGVVNGASTSVIVPISDYLLPNTSVEWVDKVKCATFVKNVTKNIRKVKTTTNSWEAGSETNIDEQQTISQHSEPAGSIAYKLDATSNKSNLEPFRLMKKVSNFDGDIGGKQELNVKTITTTVTIDVSSPH